MTQSWCRRGGPQGLFHPYLRIRELVQASGGERAVVRPDREPGEVTVLGLVDTPRLRHRHVARGATRADRAGRAAPDTRCGYSPESGMPGQLRVGTDTNEVRITPDGSCSSASCRPDPFSRRSDPYIADSGGRFEKHEVFSAVRQFILFDSLTIERVCGYLYVVTLGAVAR